MNYWWTADYHFSHFNIKNIKITHKKIFSFEFFAPFSFLYFEEKQKCQPKNLKRLTKIRPPKSTFALTDGLKARLCNTLYTFLAVQ